jgi:hypothetical protein
MDVNSAGIQRKFDNLRFTPSGQILGVHNANLPKQPHPENAKKSSALARKSSSDMREPERSCAGKSVASHRPRSGHPPSRAHYQVRTALQSKSWRVQKT